VIKVGMHALIVLPSKPVQVHRFDCWGFLCRTFCPPSFPSKCGARTYSMLFRNWSWLSATPTDFGIAFQKKKCTL